MVYSRFIYNSLKLWTNKMSYNTWMVKQTVVYPCHEYYSAKERNNIQQLILLIHTTIWKYLKGIVLSERKPISKYLALYDFIHKNFWSVKIRVMVGREEEIGMALRGSIRGYLWWWNSFVFWFVFAFIFGHTYGIWKFLGRGNLCHSCNLHHSCGNVGSLTHCAKVGIKSMPPQWPELLQLDP